MESLAPPAPTRVRIQSPAEVSVVDVSMPFGSMVTFMVKWALASIPAFMLLAALGFALFVGFGFLLAMIGLSTGRAH
jgi:hypothetical protein